MRSLRNDERLIFSNENELPFVIEAKENKSVCFLMDFLSTHSKEIIELVDQYGGVLLRRFDIKNTIEFESVVLSINGMSGIDNIFMSEAGRNLVDGSRFVFHTNNLDNDRGSILLGYFHNENYYTPDVPLYMAFLCLKPSKFGGETGLINMGKIYQKLDASLRENLEKNAFFVKKLAISSIADKYKISRLRVKEICNDFGLTIVDDEFIEMYKPSVINHSKTKKIIQTNIGAELIDLNSNFLKCLIGEYKGFQWMMHKFIWGFFIFPKVNRLFLLAKLCLRQSKKFKYIYKQYKSYFRLGDCFTQNDVKFLARSMKDNLSSFNWQYGDILLIDNIQIMHTQMPKNR